VKSTVEAPLDSAYPRHAPMQLAKSKCGLVSAECVRCIGFGVVVPEHKRTRLCRHALGRWVLGAELLA
jgi:hypothetical protein